MTDPGQAVRNLIERLIPADPVKAPGSLCTDALQRVQQTIGVIRALDVSIHLGAEESTGERMVRVTGHTDCAPVLDGDEHCAGVWTIVRTCAMHDRRIGNWKRLGAHGNRSRRKEQS